MAILSKTETLTKNGTTYIKTTYYEIDELGGENIRATVESLPYTEIAEEAVPPTPLERIEANTDYLVMIMEV
ncbi:MAG: hypothetical protein VB120_07600 [Lachnospiraceae bacterium]|nr:hypothetical protein [Lachnospiraceae bacterium]